LNRTWVEPCVRNGCIEPCRCGYIREVPRWTQAAEDAALAQGRDPGMLPYINDKCKLDLGQRDKPNDYVAEAYPLSAYLDMEAIAAEYDPGRIVTYSSWCHEFNRTMQPAVRPEFKRWIWPVGYNFDMATQYIDPAFPVAVGDMWFARQAVGRAGRSRESAMAQLASDASPNLFMFHFYRAMFANYYSFPAVPINRWHVAAVRRYVEQELGGHPFVAFHWRSEQVDGKLIVPCSSEIAGIASAALPRFVSPARPKAVLVSDMPAPGNPNRMWNDYVGGEDEARHTAMGNMLAAGFRKYDAHVVGMGQLVDAGVLSLRDFLLSVTADWYVTCQGDHWKDCHGCFRSGSNIVTRISKERQRRNLPFSHHWFEIGAAVDVPETLGRGDGRVLPGNASSRS